MRNIGFKKGLVIGIIVLFIGMSVVSSNAVSIQKETSTDKVTSDAYTLEVICLDEMPYWGGAWFPVLMPIKVTLTLKNPNETINKVKWTRGGTCHFEIPEEGYDKILHAVGLFWHQAFVKWQGKTQVLILMAFGIYNPKTLNNPFFNHFSMLEHGAESDDNDEIEPLDSSDEIISFISGGAYIWEIDGFIIKHIVCDDGHINIFAISSNWFPELIIAKSLEAERFIGFFMPVANYWYGFSGIAFGNIEWEYA